MCKKYVESNIPEHYKVSVTHLHAGNSSRKQRKGHTYNTIARLIDKDTDRIVGFGESYCSRRETPSRKVGRSVAIGRAMRSAGI